MAIEQAVNFVRERVRRGGDIGHARRRDRWELPPEAVREAVVNAVVHSDYSRQEALIRLALCDDRLEDENPGLMPFGLTIEDIRRGISRLRNRGIGRVCHELGFTEQWGSGIPRMMAACREAGLSLPTLEEAGFRFRMTMSSVRVTEPVFDKADPRMLNLIRNGEGRTTAQIAEHIGISPRTTRSRLAAGRTWSCEQGRVWASRPSPAMLRLREHVASTSGLDQPGRNCQALRRSILDLHG